MMHDIAKEDYIKDPCGVCSTAYWKNSELTKPENIQVVHERDYIASPGDAPMKYFKLLHSLEHISASSSDNYIIETVDVYAQKQLVSSILERCYNSKYPTELIDSWTRRRVFSGDLWIFATDKSTRQPAALGIADFDADINEGSLEWIQVLPEHRSKGLGQLIVNELLLRLKGRADFATVSGQCDNETKPELLYRKCGFTGDDIWYVVRT